MRDKPHTWVQWLPLAEWWYNSTYHSFIKTSPYQALYGQSPPSIEPDTTAVQAVDLALRDRDSLIQQLRQNLQVAQERMKFFADRHRTDREFHVGD